MNKLYLKLKISGKFSVNLVGINDSRQITIKKINILNGDSGKEVLIQFPNIDSFDIVSFELISLSNNSIFYSGSYGTDSSEINKIHLFLGICTYKREEFIKRNINRICNASKSPTCILHNKIDIIISDNAKTLSKSSINYEEVHLYQNNNCGGSGGFAKTMIDSIQLSKTKRDFSHLILMDDDVEFNLEALIRTYTLLAHMKSKYNSYFVGGAMFNMDHPNIMHCSGETWTYNKPWNPIISHNFEKDMTLCKNVFDSENEIVAKNNEHIYQAWWYCAIPKKYIKFDNLPMPYFKYQDDIEFSIRKRSDVVLLNGIAVWHISFASKYSSNVAYYHIRNTLTTCASLNLHITKKVLFYYALRKTIRFLSEYEYPEHFLMLKGISDFLKGPKYLNNLDSSKLHSLLIRYDRKMLKVVDFPEINIAERYKNNTCRHISKFIKIITFNGGILPSAKKAVTGMFEPKFDLSFRAKYLYHYEPLSENCFVTKRNIFKTVFALFRTFLVLTKALFIYDVVNRSYKKSRRTLISEKSWLEKILIENELK